MSRAPHTKEQRPCHAGHAPFGSAAARSLCLLAAVDGRRRGGGAGQQQRGSALSVKHSHVGHAAERQQVGSTRGKGPGLHQHQQAQQGVGHQPAQRGSGQRAGGRLQGGRAVLAPALPGSLYMALSCTDFLHHTPALRRGKHPAKGQGSVAACAEQRSTRAVHSPQAHSRPLNASTPTPHVSTVVSTHLKARKVTRSAPASAARARASAAPPAPAPLAVAASLPARRTTLLHSESSVRAMKAVCCRGGGGADDHRFSGRRGGCQAF